MSSPPARAPSFAALRHRGYRGYVIGATIAMMGDNIEHVISYWVLHQKFHSPALGAFAVISHWVPFLLLSGYTGALADRYNPRRIMQIGMLHLYGRVGRLGRAVSRRAPADLAGLDLAGHSRTGRRAVESRRAGADLRHRRPRASAKRGTPQRQWPLPGHARRSRGRQRAAAGLGSHLRNIRQRAHLPSDGDLAGQGALRAAPRRTAAPRVTPRACLGTRYSPRSAAWRATARSWR